MYKVTFSREQAVASPRADRQECCGRVATDAMFDPAGHAAILILQPLRVST